MVRTLAFQNARGYVPAIIYFGEIVGNKFALEPLPALIYLVKAASQQLLSANRFQTIDVVNSNKEPVTHLQ